MKVKTKSVKNKQQKPRLQDAVKVNLPNNYVWKVLAALTKDLEHLLTEDELAALERICRNKDLSAYLALSEAWSLQCITSMDRPLSELRAIYQLSSLLKKFRFPTDAAAREAKAKEKFFLAEASCASYNSSYVQYLKRTADEDLAHVYSYAQGFLRKLLGDVLPDSSKLTEWSRHGPGSNLDTDRDKISSYDKYNNWPYSCTSGAFGYARFAIMADQRWFGALEDSYRRRNKIPKHSILDWPKFWTSVIKTVPGNRITFVPKNALTERSIAIEPTLNLYLQLGVDGYIRRRLKRWGIDIDDQEKNQELARLGSRDGTFATLDLSAASDSISLKLCELLLPRDWYDYLLALRSPVGEIDGKMITYEKVSSMGNGFTFALETALFASTVYGVMMVVEGRYDPKRCAVYGDDLIVPTEHCHMVIDALTMFGFQLNLEKSFTSGPIRESCGADWFDGQPIRPVFMTSQPENVMQLWTDRNRLQRILNLRWLIDESHVISLLDKWCPEKFRNVTGPYSDEDFDSYMHTDSTLNGRYKFCMWKYKRLVVRPRVRNRHSAFLFRKLMTDLRPTANAMERWTSNVPVDHAHILPKWLIPKWKRVSLKAAGSRFDITRRNLVMLSYTYSTVDTWRCVYAE